MNTYIYYLIIFLIVRAFIKGFQNYSEYKTLGYNKIWFEQTGEKILFNGSTKEMISMTIVSALSLILSPIFLVLESLKFLPIAVIIYFTS